MAESLLLGVENIGNHTATVKFITWFDEKLYRNKYLNNDYAFLNLYYYTKP